MRVIFACPGGYNSITQYMLRAMNRENVVLHLDLRQLSIRELRDPLGLRKTVRKVLKENYCKPADFDLFLSVNDHPKHFLRGVPDLGIPTANWHLDTHLFPEYHQTHARDYDWVFYAHKKYQGLFAECANKSAWVPLAFDPWYHRMFQGERDLEVASVGNMAAGLYNERIRLSRILEGNFKTTILQGIFYEDVARLYSRSQIVFNRSLMGVLNQRVFEGMSAGALMVTDVVDGLLDLFTNKKHLVTYETDAELITLVRHYLDHPEEAREIARAGRETVLENHTFEHRWQDMVKLMGISRK
ncbi:MAG: glycosyltransferase [Euryarchaeota archaeon]|nr:glycosyltransferase [Euryarchaeota archaeon]